MLSRRRCCCTTSCLICVAVTNCAGAAVSGATVTVTDSGGSVIGSATTGSSGFVCIAVPGADTYTVAASKSGQYGSNKSVVVASCPTTTTVALTVSAPSSGATVQSYFLNVGSGIPLLISRLSINGGTYAPDSSGAIRVALPPGSYPYTLSAPRYVSQSGTATISPVCGGYGAAFALAVDPAYTLAEAPAGGGIDPTIPVAKTLYLTDSRSGLALTMTAVPYPSPTSQVSRWYGPGYGVSFDGHAAAAANCGTCAAATNAGWSYELRPWINTNASVSIISAFTNCAGNNPPYSGSIPRSLAITAATQLPVFTATHTFSGSCQHPYLAGDTITISE